MANIEALQLGVSFPDPVSAKPFPIFKPVVTEVLERHRRQAVRLCRVPSPLENRGFILAYCPNSHGYLCFTPRPAPWLALLNTPQTEMTLLFGGME